MGGQRAGRGAAAAIIAGPWLALACVFGWGLFDSVSARVSLVEAVKARDAAEVRRLIGAGANVDTAEPDGTTALHWAVQTGDAAMVDLLLRARANANALNRYKVAPIQLAAASGNAPIVRLLLDAGADATVTMPGGETTLMAAARTGSLDAVELLLSRGVDVNAKESLRGQNPRMWAAQKGPTPVVKARVGRR